MAVQNRFITVFVLLAVAVSGLAFGEPLAPPAGPVAEHAQTHLPDHACCPRAMHTQPAPVPKPDTNHPNNDHRCCFLRGPVSSLPIGAASGKKPISTGLLQAAAGLNSFGNAYSYFASLEDSAASPPHSLQMSVVLRN